MIYSDWGVRDLTKRYLPQVLGPEKRGRARGLGFDTTPTNTFGLSSFRMTPQSQHEVTNLRQIVNSLESEVETL